MFGIKLKWIITTIVGAIISTGVGIIISNASKDSYSACVQFSRSQLYVDFDKVFVEVENNGDMPIKDFQLEIVTKTHTIDQARNINSISLDSNNSCKTIRHLITDSKKPNSDFTGSPRSISHYRCTILNPGEIFEYIYRIRGYSSTTVLVKGDGYTMLFDSKNEKGRCRT